MKLVLPFFSQTKATDPGVQLAGRRTVENVLANRASHSENENEEAPTVVPAPSQQHFTTTTEGLSQQQSCAVRRGLEENDDEASVFPPPAPQSHGQVLPDPPQESVPPLKAPASGMALLPYWNSGLEDTVEYDEENTKKEDGTYTCDYCHENSLQKAMHAEERNKDFYNERVHDANDAPSTPPADRYDDGALAGKTTEPRVGRANTHRPSVLRPGVSLFSSRVGAVAIQGPGAHDEETGDISTISDRGTVVARPVAHGDLEGEIREQLRTEMRGELQSAEAVTSDARDSGERSHSIFTRRRFIFLVFIASIAVVGLMAGLLLSRQPADLNTIYGLNPGDRFADYMVISRDASTLAIGSDKESYVMVFRRSGREWNQIGQTLKRDGQFGRSLDLNRNGSMLVVGSWSNDDVADLAGKTTVFWYNGTLWDQVGQELFGDMTHDRYVSSCLNSLWVLWL